MPQLDFNFYLSQTSWLFIIFIIFHVYMKLYIFPFFYEYFYLSKSNFHNLQNHKDISFFSFLP